MMRAKFKVRKALVAGVASSAIVAGVLVGVAGAQRERIRRTMSGGGAPNEQKVAAVRQELEDSRKDADKGLGKSAQGWLNRAEKSITFLVRKHGKDNATVRQLIREFKETEAYVKPKIADAQAKKEAKDPRNRMAASKYSMMSFGILDKLENLKERVDQHAGKPNDPKAFDTYVAARKLFAAVRSDIKRTVAEKNPEEVEMVNKAVEDAENHLWSVVGDHVAKRAASTQAPEDIYRRNDKADLEQRIRKQWKLARPDVQILGVRFDQENWVISKRKVYNDAINQWQIYDSESLRVAVIVKRDEKLASIYDVFPSKDHTQGGALEVGDFSFREEMLAANIR